MSLGENIIKYRKLLEMKAADLCRKAGIDTGYMSEIERDKKTPTLKTLQKIATALDVTVSDLIGETIPILTVKEKQLLDAIKHLDTKYCNELIRIANLFSEALSKTNDTIYKICATPEIPCKKISIYGKCAAGKPIEIIENLIDEVEYTDNLPHGIDFGLKIQGNSMEPDIKDGQYVFIRKQPEIENGEIAIVEHNNEVTCKKFYKYEDRIELHPINKNYSTIILKKANVIGKVLI